MTILSKSFAIDFFTTTENNLPDLSAVLFKFSLVIKISFFRPSGVGLSCEKLIKRSRSNINRYKAAETNSATVIDNILI